MRKVPVFFAVMLIGATLGSPAEANDQCSDLSKAAHDGDSAKTAALISSGVSVNCSYTGSYVDDDTGKTVTYISTPLNTAAWGGHPKSVRLLLSHGANVNIKDGDGRTPLFNADDYLFFLEFMGGTDEEWEEADEIYRLLEQAGGVF